MATKAENAALRAATDALASRVQANADKLVACEAGHPSPADMAETEAIIATLTGIGVDQNNPLPEPTVPAPEPTEPEAA